MSGKLEIINDALEARLVATLSAVATTLVGRIAYPNVDFDPNRDGDSQAGTRWFRPTLKPGEPQQLTVGGTNYGDNQLVGLYQISCFYPKGQGRRAAQAMADDIASAFKRGSTFTSAGVNVRIRLSWPSDILEEERWLHVPVSVLWWADVSNT